MCLVSEKCGHFRLLLSILMIMIFLILYYSCSGYFLFNFHWENEIVVRFFQSDTLFVLKEVHCMEGI